MKTLGIDLGAQGKRTAVCLIDWVTGQVELPSGSASDCELVDLICGTSGRDDDGVDACGIDAPFGWPSPFLNAIAAHARRERWPGSEGKDQDEFRRSLRFRRTDLIVLNEIGRVPMSVSTELVGVVAMRCARLQQLVADRGREVDRSGRRGVLLEVYPRAALHHWELAEAGYKKARGREGLEKLAQTMFDRCPRLATDQARTRCTARDDDLDAFICAVIAKAARSGQTQTVHREDEHLAAEEGWIHLPTATLEVITG